MLTIQTSFHAILYLDPAILVGFPQGRVGKKDLLTGVGHNRNRKKPIRSAEQGGVLIKNSVGNGVSVLAQDAEGRTGVVPVMTPLQVRGMGVKGELDGQEYSLGEDVENRNPAALQNQKKWPSNPSGP